MKTIPNETFATTCIKDTLNGLRAGISHFSGPSSVAVILQPLSGKSAMHL